MMTVFRRAPSTAFQARVRAVAPGALSGGRARLRKQREPAVDVAFSLWKERAPITLNFRFFPVTELSTNMVY